MEVGDYVRTKNGEIFKLNNIIYQDDNYIQYQLGGRLEDKDFLKSSPNIIDLIEVGDYVNGEEVKEKFNYLLGFECGQDGEYYRDENEIETIVTKEMFESMEYKVC